MTEDLVTMVPLVKLHGPVLFTVLFLSLLTAVNATVNSSSQLMTSHRHTCPLPAFTEVNNIHLKYIKRAALYLRASLFPNMELTPLLDSQQEPDRVENPERYE